MNCRFLRFLRNPFVIGALLGVISLHFYRELSIKLRRAPAPLVEVASWQLINHNTQSFGSDDLAGKVFIANFFFTSCPTICPRLISNMKLLNQKMDKYNDKVNFVSFSVDPSTDTPKILKAYMNKFDISAPNWFFVTGEERQVYETIVDKMKVHIGDKKAFESNPSLYDISHMAHFALFDQKGRLRGLFPSEPEGLAALSSAAKLLVDKGAGA